MAKTRKETMPLPTIRLGYVGSSNGERPKLGILDVNNEPSGSARMVWTGDEWETVAPDYEIPDDAYFITPGVFLYGPKDAKVTAATIGPDGIEARIEVKAKSGTAKPARRKGSASKASDSARMDALEAKLDKLLDALS